MNEFDRAEMKHDLDKAVFYYDEDECEENCECDLCAKIDKEEE